MRVKKFEAKSMKEALQMVKKELGPDAVILGARDNRKSFGIGGQASVEITAAVSETTLRKKAFVESRMTVGDQDRFAKSDARTQRAIIEKMVDSRQRQANVQSDEPVRRAMTARSYIDIQDEEMEPGPRRAKAYDRATGRSVNELLSDFNQDFQEDEPWQARPVRDAARAVAPAPSRSGGSRENATARNDQHETETQAPVSERALSRIRNAAREAFTNNPFFDEDTSRRQARDARAPQTQTRAGSSGHSVEMISEQASPVPPGAVSGAQTQDISNLKNEISRLQGVIEGFQKVPQTFIGTHPGMHPGADFGIPYDMSHMFQKLVDSGITVDNTVDILQHAAKELDPVAMKKPAIVDAWVARHILTNTHIARSPWHGRVHLFVGGAGSGKTSTLVKMASHLVVKEKKKVAILSTDSFKVGAIDQLKIYCQILNVPFAVIRNRKDWEWVLSQLHHVDHVLVDFPGLQLRDLEEIHLLKSLLPPTLGAHEGTACTTHFCISATSKDGDAYEIARRYKVADPHDIIFTNLDQSVQHGIIYNLQKKMNRPLHSFGIGNRIPEDFEAASKERVLDLIFKLTKWRRDTK